MPVSVVICRAQRDDLADLADVERAAAKKFQVHFGSSSGYVLPHEILERARAADLLWLVVAEGKTIGFLAATPLQNSLHIEEISVVYEHQGKGYGRRLMETILAEAAARRTSVTLTTENQVPWSYPFYGRLGFTDIDLAECPHDLAAILLRDKQHTSQPETRVAMRLDLEKTLPG